MEIHPARPRGGDQSGFRPAPQGLRGATVTSHRTVVAAESSYRRDGGSPRFAAATDHRGAVPAHRRCRGGGTQRRDGPASRGTAARGLLRRRLRFLRSESKLMMMRVSTPSRIFASIFGKAGWPNLEQKIRLTEITLSTENATAKGLKNRIFSPGQGRRGSWKPWGNTLTIAARKTTSSPTLGD
jgi:hypothetical protein